MQGGGVKRLRIWCVKNLDNGSLLLGKLNEERPFLPEGMTRKKVGKELTGIKQRRLGGRMLNEITGDQIMKVIRSEHGPSCRIVLLQYIEETVEVPVRVNV